MKTCRFFRISAVKHDSSVVELGFCGREAYYRDSLGRPLCDACASEVMLEDGDNVFGPSGRRLSIAAVH